MTEELRLTLFGTPQVRLGETQLQFSTAKAEALLYYLAVTGRPQSREKLADLLWGEMPDAKAKRNLTATLTTLRKSLAPYLNVEPQTIAFNFESSHQLDVNFFQDYIQSSQQTEDLTPLRQATKLYQGEFLASLQVKKAYVFEEWLLTERERLRDLMLQALDLLIDDALNEGEAKRGLDYATQLLELDPWRESAHRQMMRLLALDGQRSAALAQFEICRQVLAEELGVEPTSETITLYERLRGTQTPIPNNLPPLSIFVGRVKLIRQVLTQLDQVECRLLTLVGPGGIGKTRLAIEAARQATQPQQALTGEVFQDGVYFVNLAPLNTAGTTSAPQLANGVATAIAETIDLTFHGSDNPFTQLLNYVKTKKMLLILDNFEQLADEAHILSHLLQQSSSLKLLVTSRERLKIVEEWVLEIEGLAYPERMDLLPLSEASTLADLESYEAIALFVAQGQQVQAGFSLSAPQAEPIVRICQLVQGIPLALVLAASWLPVLSCVEIVTEIENSLDFLETSLRNIPERHRSLRAIFNYSWQMLTTEEQTMYARLSIFRDGFTRKAAQQIVGANLNNLATLVDKSLLRLTENGRYEIHELLRQFAHEILLNQSAQTIQQKYSTFYLQFMVEQEAELWGQSPQLALAKIKVDLSNIRQAWQLAVTQVNLSVLEASIGGLSRFFDLSGFFAEGESLFSQTADQLPATSASDSKQVSQIQCRLWIEQARMMHRRGLPEQAVDIAKKATDLAQTLNAPTLAAMAHHQWGEAALHNGLYERAHTQLSQALTFIEPDKHQRIAGEIWRDLGQVAHRQGNYDKAEDSFSRSLACFEAISDARGVTIMLMNLSNLAYERGDLVKVRQSLAQVLHNFQQIDDRWGQCVVTVNLSVLAYEEANYTKGLVLVRQAMTLARQLQDKVHEALALNYLGNLLRDQGAFAKAKVTYAEALKLVQQTGDQYNEGFILADQAFLFYLMGDYHTAKKMCDEAEQHALKTEMPSLQAIALTFQGGILLALNEPTLASESYQQALTIRQDLGEQHRAIETLAGLGQVYLIQNELDQALIYVEQLLEYLAAQATIDGFPLAGIPAPFRVYLTCLQILQANQDPRIGDVLATAQALLQAQVAKIEDEALRHSFLENIVTHRELAHLSQTTL